MGGASQPITAPVAMWEALSHPRLYSACILLLQQQLNTSSFPPLLSHPMVMLLLLLLLVPVTRVVTQSCLSR